MTGVAISVRDIRAARDRIAGYVSRTPLLPAPWAGPDVWLKAENLQPTGAFKLRGATNAIRQLTSSARARGVVTHSSGNHGQAVAYAARGAGVAATIVIPDGAAPVKVAACRALGAEVVRAPVADRAAVAHALSVDRGMTIVHPFDDPQVIAGQGTLALEVLDDLDAIDTVLVPVGGGGLISGVAVAVQALSPRTRVIGVESELAADARASLIAGRRISWSDADTQRTVADGTRTGSLGTNTFPIIQRHVEEIVTVSEEAILAATGRIARQSRMVAEPSGALSVAAIQAAPHRYGRCVAVISGGNVDPSLLARVITAGPCEGAP